MPHSRARLARSLAVLAAVALLPLLSACGGGQPSVSAESRAKAVKVDADTYATLGYRLEWRGFPVMNPGSAVTFFDVLGDVVVCQESSSIVTILDAKSGTLRCSDQLANPITKFVGNVRDGNRIVCSSETDAYFLSVDTCTLVDRHNLTRVVTTRPALAGGILVYGTATGEIVRHMVGRSINLEGNSVPGDVIADPVAVGSLVAFVSQRGEVLVLDAASSSSLGRNRIQGGVAPDDHFGGPLGASASTLFVASLDQSLYAFDLQSARQLWRVRTDSPLRSHPVHHGDALYCDIASQGLTAFDPGTGKARWTSPTVSGTPVALRRGRLIVWDAPSRTAITVDPASGQVIDRVPLNDISFIRTDTFADGNVYTVSPNGVVCKFTPRT